MCMQSLPGSLFLGPPPRESLGTVQGSGTYPPLKSTRQPQQLMSLTTDDRVESVKCYHLHIKIIIIHDSREWFNLDINFHINSDHFACHSYLHFNTC